MWKSGVIFSVQEIYGGIAKDAEDIKGLFKIHKLNINWQCYVKKNAIKSPNLYI